MNFDLKINIPIANNEVPELRAAVGWERREQDYPKLFERCNFWIGVRNDEAELIAFGYVCGMGLEHGYMEDIMVHPSYQGKGLATKMIKEMLGESNKYGLEIVSITYEKEKESLYKKCGFNPGTGGVWKNNDT
ncbi:GNAT family N-acetyltransferase [Halalkalibacillus halophilus]|uniref:GNAT family N-acetyltransferase n=1 Tax=Halalkalibacillus halophilus TaxID=392827 RepID=UPI0003F8D8F4|nr:GNAT family N-acetyltransferase [Halalkalibacillus halophilus]